MTILKNRLVVIIIAIGLFLLALFYKGIYPTGNVIPNSFRNPETLKQVQGNKEEIQLLSTNPDPLENATILPDKVVEVTFNRALPSADALMYKIDPKIDTKVELANGGKTVRFVAKFELGQGYTLFILPDSSFIDTKEAHQKLGKEYIYHFKTIDYRGV